MLKTAVVAALLVCAAASQATARAARQPAPCFPLDFACLSKPSNPFSGAVSIRVRRMHRVRRGANPRARLAQQMASGEVVSHPSGCPARSFCGCGAAVRIFGRSIRELWLAANWFRFPRTAPAPGMAAVKRHHVFVLERHINGNLWMAYDANSGRHLTRIHPRSITGFVIVNPHGRATKRHG